MLVFAPQPSAYYSLQPSPRDRYLRAIAEEKAARQAYARDLASQYTSPYLSSSGGYGYDYDELQQLREREYARRQQIAALKQRERQRLLFEEEQRRHHQQQLEYQRQLRQRQRELDDEDSEMEHPFLRALRAHMVRNEKPEQQEQRQGDVESDTKHPAQEVKAHRTPQPTLEQKQEAAVKIQSLFRAHSARRRALSHLSPLRASLDNIKSSFTFPSSPQFASDASSAQLLYVHQNAPIHAYEDSLVRLLSKIDEVETGGDKVVRKERKALAMDVEAALEELDRMKEEAWEKQIKATTNIDVAMDAADVAETPMEETISEPTLATTSLDTVVPMEPVAVSKAAVVEEANSEPTPSTASVDSTTPTSSPTHHEDVALEEVEVAAALSPPSEPSIPETEAPIFFPIDNGDIIPVEPPVRVSSPTSSQVDREDTTPPEAPLATASSSEPTTSQVPAELEESKFFPITHNGNIVAVETPKRTESAVMEEIPEDEVLKPEEVEISYRSAAPSPSSSPSPAKPTEPAYDEDMEVEDIVHVDSELPIIESETEPEKNEEVEEFVVV